MRAKRSHPCHRIIELPGKPTLIFVTVGLEDSRQGTLATPEIHALLRDIWLHEAVAWRVNWYEIMPDHLHFFTAPGNMDISLKRWVTFWKSLYTKAYLPHAPTLQVDYWDTTIRSAAHYAEKLTYMRENPVRKALVKDADTWPYQGIIFDFVWMETA
ncbi:MAG: transposase [Armatimonadota bacterium]